MNLILFTLSLFLLHLRTFAAGQQYLSPVSVYEGIQQNLFDLIMDVRTTDEWNQGHIPNATLVESLSLQSTTPMKLQGCEGACRTIVVYCRTGARAGVAIDLMLANGFNGTIFNGRGTSQWVSAGYDLVNDDSVTPKCSVEVDNALPCESFEEEKFITTTDEEEKVVMTTTDEDENVVVTTTGEEEEVDMTTTDEEEKVMATTETKDLISSASCYDHQWPILCRVIVFYLFQLFG